MAVLFPGAAGEFGRRIGVSCVLCGYTAIHRNQSYSRVFPAEVEIGDTGGPDREAMGLERSNGSQLSSREFALLRLQSLLQSPDDAQYGHAMSDSFWVMKRLFDVVVATALLILLSPCLAVVAILVWRDSPGGIVFSQQRVGRDGRAFTMFKFRTMIVGAAEQGSHSTAANDWRITRIGEVLRRTSLDELPQLANVLRGDMSLVGPRPEVPVQRELYSDEEWRQRHLVRPGITGLAQARFRSAASPEQRKALDLSYVRDANLLLDLKILLWTFTQLRGGV